jgi:hypothetical protein
MSGAEAKSTFTGSLKRVEVYRAATGKWEEVPLNRWHAVKLWFRRLFK